MAQKKLLLEEICQNMFITHIEDGHEDLIFFVTHKGENDPEELYGWSINELKKEPARLLVQSSHWIFFCHGDGDYFRLLTEEEKGKTTDSIMKKIPDSFVKMVEIIKKL